MVVRAAQCAAGESKRRAARYLDIKAVIVHVRKIAGVLELSVAPFIKAEKAVSCLFKRDARDLTIAYHSGVHRSIVRVLADALCKDIVVAERRHYQTAHRLFGREELSAVVRKVVGYQYRKPVEVVFLLKIIEHRFDARCFIFAHIACKHEAARCNQQDENK